MESRRYDPAMCFEVLGDGRMLASKVITVQDKLRVTTSSHENAVSIFKIGLALV
jgi:hypothetical protein